MKKINKYDVIRYIVLSLIIFFIQILFNDLVYRTDWLSVVYGMSLLLIGVKLNELFIEILDTIKSYIELNKAMKELDKILEDLRKEFTNEGDNKDDSE